VYKLRNPINVIVASTAACILIFFDCRRLRCFTIKVCEYGNKMIGSEFSVIVNGLSLGGGLGLLFGFYASTDERLTRISPVKIFTYGMPLIATNSFADAFRHQEMSRKVQHARFYNHNDVGEYYNS